MKRLKRVGSLGLLLAGITASSLSYGQNSNINAAIVKDTVSQIGKLMQDNYVFPKQGEKAAKALNQKFLQGAFDELNDSDALASMLTQELQAVTQDKHLRVRTRQAGGKQHTQADMVNKKHSDRERQRQGNQGIAQVSRLESNIGYLDLRGFVSFDQGKTAIDAAMSLLNSSDSMIIDLRKNGGGDPQMVQYLCSFFFKDRLLLNSLYWREGNVTNEFWTLDKVSGDKLPEMPLYILTSGYTFSAAEEFSYNMQSRKRATIVGETTGGGAHPGGRFNINDHFRMFIATGRAINPITKTNWEGSGVVPDVKVNEDSALEKAIELAKVSAEQVRQVARSL